jgi:hypothetical protein
MVANRFGAYIKAVGANADSEARGFTASTTSNGSSAKLAGKYSMDDAAESATLARVAFLGDDGYGWNSVGRMAA